MADPAMVSKESSAEKPKKLLANVSCEDLEKMSAKNVRELKRAR